MHQVEAVKPLLVLGQHASDGLAVKRLTFGLKVRPYLCVHSSLFQFVTFCFTLRDGMGIWS